MLVLWGQRNLFFYASRLGCHCDDIRKSFWTPSPLVRTKSPSRCKEAVKTLLRNASAVSARLLCLCPVNYVEMRRKL